MSRSSWWIPTASDRTGEIASSCRFISKSASIAAARNIGFKEARGDIFISIDSDMVLEDGLFSEIVGLMESNDALIISETGKGVSLLSRLKALEKRFYLNNAGIECARVFSRAAFFRKHGYDESLRLAEDRDFHQQGVHWLEGGPDQKGRLPRYRRADALLRYAEIVCVWPKPAKILE